MPTMCFEREQTSHMASDKVTSLTHLDVGGVAPHCMHFFLQDATHQIMKQPEISLKPFKKLQSDDHLQLRFVVS